MPKLTVHRAVFAGFGTAAVAVLALAGFTWNFTQQTLQAANFVAHTHEVLGAIGDTEATLFRAEAGQRAFLVARRLRFQQERDSAVRDLRTRLTALDSLTSAHAGVGKKPGA